MARLTAADRRRIPADRFGLPGTDRYPIEDEKHAKLAVDMAPHAGPKKEKEIDRRVHRFYPRIKISALKKK